MAVRAEVWARSLSCRQEALLAAISEKDANIALLELSSSKKKTQEEVAALKREKDRLVQQLKQQVWLMGGRGWGCPHPCQLCTQVRRLTHVQFVFPSRDLSLQASGSVQEAQSLLGKRTGWGGVTHLRRMFLNFCSSWGKLVQFCPLELKRVFLVGGGFYSSLHISLGQAPGVHSTGRCMALVSTVGYLQGCQSPETCLQVQRPHVRTGGSEVEQVRSYHRLVRLVFCVPSDTLYRRHQEYFHLADFLFFRALTVRETFCPLLFHPKPSPNLMLDTLWAPLFVKIKTRNLLFDDGCTTI